MWSFETLDACESKMGNTIRGFESIKNKDLSNLPRVVVERAMRFAAVNCIGSDDPRLKGN
jgi:hypothetical protein